MNESSPSLLELYTEIETAFDEAASGHGRALVLLGRTGSGKTHLLDWSHRVRDDFRIVHLSGVAAESNLPFGALHRLLIPYATEIDRLPGPQRRVLHDLSTFEHRTAEDEFLVGVAAGALLARCTEPQPLLCTYDDVQWIDEESLRAISFVARRLKGERISIILVGDDSPKLRVALAGITTRDLAWVSVEDIGRLLLERGFEPVDSTLIREALARTEGDVEAALAFLSGDKSTPSSTSTRTWASGHTQGPTDALPEETVRWLLLAAAEPSGNYDCICRAAELQGLDESASIPAEEARLITVRATVEFADHSIRDRIYTDALRHERRAAHQALARVTDEARDPDIHAWHLASASAGPDDSAADLLDDTSETAFRRGGYAALATVLEFASNLTSSEKSQSERAIRAAEAAMTAGQPLRAQKLLRRADLNIVDQSHSERAHAILGGATWLAGPAGALGQVPAFSLAAARKLFTADPERARDIVLHALTQASVAGTLAEGITFTELTSAAEALVRGEPSTLRNDLIRGMAAHLQNGTASSAPIFRGALAASERGSVEDSQLLNFHAAAHFATTVLWDERAGDMVLHRAASSARATGALTVLERVLWTRALHETSLGNIVEADRATEDIKRVRQEIGLPELPAESLTTPLRSAWSGDNGDRTLGTASLRRVRTPGSGLEMILDDQALVVELLAAGRYAEALIPLAEVALALEPLHMADHVASDLVETHALSGDLSAARLPLQQLRRAAQDLPDSKRRQGLLKRCEALCAPDNEVDALFGQSILYLERTLAPAELARTRLLFGEWLIGQGRSGAASRQLQWAADIFERIGARAFLGRAREQLSRMAVPVTSERCPVDLTAQEKRIGDLASAGESNGDIAQQLGISPSTVDYHLQKVYRKLGINSRHALAGRLLASSSTSSVPSRDEK